MTKLVKKRYWEIIGYPESLPNDWKDILIQTGLPCAISPLHDKDIMDNGEYKKAHYHILVIYQGPTSQNSVSNLSNKLNSPLPQFKDSIKGAYEYHSHKNAPEKYQYNPKDEQFINNFDIRDYLDYSKQELLELKSQVISIIRDKNIQEYCDLCDYLQDFNLELFDFVTDHTILFSSYCRSKFYKNHNDHMKYNAQTGEYYEN